MTQELQALLAHKVLKATPVRKDLKVTLERLALRAHKVRRVK